MTERAQRIRSIRIIEEYHWMLLRQLDVAVRKRLGERARWHVETNFSRAAFGAHFESVLRAVVRHAR